MPRRLRGLKLSKPSIEHIESFKLKVRSATLEEINAKERIGNRCWCDEVVRPSLKLFECEGHSYGNGIRPRLPFARVNGVCLQYQSNRY
jgi:hypothetical protein